MRRGEVWWVAAGTLADPRALRRGPVLVVQVNAFNRSVIPTVLVATLTADLALAEAPGNVLLTAAQSGLGRSSVVDVSRILTLDRRQLQNRVGRLPPGPMAAVEDGLRLALALEPWGVSRIRRRRAVEVKGTHRWSASTRRN